MSALVQGGRMGGGFELALGCDMIVATRSATFRFPEAGLGILSLQGGVMQLAEHSAVRRLWPGGCRRRSRMGAITRDCASCRRRATRWLGFVGPEAFRVVARGRDGFPFEGLEPDDAATCRRGCRAAWNPDRMTRRPTTFCGKVACSTKSAIRPDSRFVVSLCGASSKNFD
jgi:hypothetical protein